MSDNKGFNGNVVFAMCDEWMPGQQKTRQRDWVTRLCIAQLAEVVDIIQRGPRLDIVNDNQDKQGAYREAWQWVNEIPDPDRCMSLAWVLGVLAESMGYALTIEHVRTCLRRVDDNPETPRLHRTRTGMDNKRKLNGRCRLQSL